MRGECEVKAWLQMDCDCIFHGLIYPTKHAQCSSHLTCSLHAKDVPFDEWMQTQAHCVNHDRIMHYSAVELTRTRQQEVKLDLRRSISDCRSITLSNAPLPANSNSRNCNRGLSLRLTDGEGLKNAMVAIWERT